MLDFFLMIIPKNKTAVNTPPSLVQGWGLLIFHAELQQREVNCQHGFSVTVPQGEVQDWCASPLQSLQLQESNVLWALWHAALGPCTARTEVWWWVSGVCGTGWAWEQAAFFSCLSNLKRQISFLAFLSETWMRCCQGWWRCGQEDHTSRRIYRRICDPWGWRVTSQRDKGILQCLLLILQNQEFWNRINFRTLFSLSDRPKTLPLHVPTPKGRSCFVTTVISELKCIVGFWKSVFAKADGCRNTQ